MPILGSYIFSFYAYFSPFLVIFVPSLSPECALGDKILSLARFFSFIKILLGLFFSSTPVDNLIYI